MLQPYRGYGSAEEVFLMGRLFRQLGRPGRFQGGFGRDLVDLLRRLSRWGVGDAEILARFAGAEQRLRTDRDGYFRVRLRPAEPLATDRRWHPVELHVGAAPDPGAHVRGQVYVPPPDARFVVISDIDDTVVETGVANKALMLWRLFLQRAESRVAFPGVAAFYRGLHEGPAGGAANPMLYVSRAPWSLYEVLEEFFQRHGIPRGPILFLREWGLTLQRPLPRRSPDHKRDLMRGMLACYRSLPFVLIGDSGQRDPEIYTEIVREHPGRVLAVYVRDVSHGPERTAAIAALADEVAAAGSALVLSADTRAMAEHAAAHGLLSPEAVESVRQGCATPDAPRSGPARTVGEGEERGSARPGPPAPAQEPPRAGGESSSSTVAAPRGRRPGP